MLSWVGRVVLAIVTFQACAKEEARPAVPVEPPRSRAVARVEEAASGMVVYKDPATGQLGPRPAGVPQLAPDPKTTAALDDSATGLTEERSPGGGTMVDLRGRFQNMATVRIGADGRVVDGDCTTAKPEAR